MIYPLVTYAEEDMVMDRLAYEKESRHMNKKGANVKSSEERPGTQERQEPEHDENLAIEVLDMLQMELSD